MKRHSVSHRLMSALAVTGVLVCVSFGLADDTRDLLDEIDHAPAAAASAPASAARETAQGAWSLVRFFAPTLACAAAIGLCGGVLGTFVLRRGEALIALALPQAAAVGAAVGMRMGWPELPPALVATAAALTLFVRDHGPRGGRTRGPTAVPAMYVAMLCVSFLVIAHSGQHVEELQNLFTGIDVAVTPTEAGVVVPLLLTCGLAVAVLWRRWLFVAQLPATAELAGVSVTRWDGWFLAALALYVLLGTATQGVVMVLAMLFIPATFAGPWAGRLPSAMAIASATALAMVAAAFALSNAFAWPLSHTVGGVGLVLLMLSRSLRTLRQ